MDRQSRAWAAVGPFFRHRITVEVLKVAGIGLGWLLLVCLLVSLPLALWLSPLFQDHKLSSLSPPMLTQIGSAGAVVTTADMPYVASRVSRSGKSQHYEGTFKAGQHLCVFSAFVGNEGYLEFGMPNGYTASAANSPGAFRPDTSAGKCSRIATLASTPDQSPASAQARETLAEFWNSGFRLLAEREFGVFYVLVILIALWQRRQNYRRRDSLELESVQRFHAGYAVREGDFEHEGKTVYRVNSDGFRVNLKEWYFDKETGEFFQVTQKIGDKGIVEAVPYGTRFIRNAKSVREKIKAVTAAILAASGSVYLLSVALDHSRDAAIAIAATAGMLVLTVVAVRYLFPPITNNYLEKAGPEPLPRGPKPEFGMQQPHGSFTSDGTI